MNHRGWPAGLLVTSLDKGRLQTLPLAYDVRKKEWFDMAASGVRHAPVGAMVAVSDDYRLVRAAAALAGAPKALVPPAVAQALEKAAAECLASLTARPDLWTSQYNLGNSYLSQGEAGRAVSHYEKARLLDPATVAPLVNLSLAHGRLGELDKAEVDLRQTLALAPDDGPHPLGAPQGDALLGKRRVRPAILDPVIRGLHEALGEP